MPSMFNIDSFGEFSEFGISKAVIMSEIEKVLQKISVLFYMQRRLKQKWNALTTEKFYNSCKTFLDRGYM